MYFTDPVFMHMFLISIRLIDRFLFVVFERIANYVITWHSNSSGLSLEPKERSKNSVTSLPSPVVLISFILGSVQVNIYQIVFTILKDIKITRLSKLQCISRSSIIVYLGTQLRVI